LLLCLDPARALPRRGTGAECAAVAVVLPHADLPERRPVPGSEDAPVGGRPTRMGESGGAVRGVGACNRLRRNSADRRPVHLRDRRRRRGAGDRWLRVPADGARPGGDCVRLAPGEVVLRNATRSFELVHERSRTLKEMFVRGGSDKERSRVVALDDVTLRIEPGEAVGMVGRNGAGKTSTLRCLAGIVPLDSGRAEGGGGGAVVVGLG